MTAGKGIVHSERTDPLKRSTGGPMHGMQANRPPDRPKHRLIGSLRPPGSDLRREHHDHQRVSGEFTGVPMHAGPVFNWGRPTPHA
jgi:redox-sensitive bicupin YhaK (pirin superfamily)